MSQAREGVTFNDIFMFMIAVPLVLLWVGSLDLLYTVDYKTTLFLNKSKDIQL